MACLNVIVHLFYQKHFNFCCNLLRKTTSDKKKNGKNDTKTNDIRKHLVNPSGTQPSAIDESDDDTKENEENTANLKNYKHFFRELDLDIWVMLSLPLTLNPEPEKVVFNFVEFVTVFLIICDNFSKFCVRIGYLSRNLGLRSCYSLWRIWSKNYISYWSPVQKRIRSKIQLRRI